METLHAWKVHPSGVWTSLKRLLALHSKAMYVYINMNDLGVRLNPLGTRSECTDLNSKSQFHTKVICLFSRAGENNMILWMCVAP